MLIRIVSLELVFSIRQEESAEIAIWLMGTFVLVQHNADQDIAL